MTTAERLLQMRETSARNDAKIASHQIEKELRRAEAIARIREMKDTVITPHLASQAIGCDPQYIRIAARRDRDALGFRVIVIGNNVRIPRQAFLNYIDGV